MQRHPPRQTGPARWLTAPAINLQRIVQSIDPLGQAGAALESTLTPLRAAAVTKIFTGFDLVHRSLFNIGTILQQPPLPAVLLGLVEQPGGGPAVGVQVELNPATLGATGDPVWGLTDGAGHFQLTPPPGLLIPAGGVELTVQGATARVAVTVAANQVASNGALGVIVLPQAVAPMPQSIIASLANIAGGLSGGGQPAPPPPAAALPTVTLGEDNGCQLTYSGQAAIDRFPYGVFFRLVAPQLSIVQTFHWTQLGNAQIPLPLYEGQVGALSGVSSYADRVPVEQPLGVDGFRDQIMGLGANGTFVSDETVPMAATLGLGYVLRLAQRWTFQGLALGDLVYSLPLAPGEQQQVAVFERTDTASVFESETLSESQAEQQIALADTSTYATFNSAFDEAASGGSSFSTHSDTSSWGVNFLVAAGGGGSSDSNGVSNSWMQGQRDAAENAAQTTHSAAENQASARRNAARTGMRLASSSESEQVTTKTITNHNHLHALTMQYWEVQRLYDVRTAVEDLDFVCLVPMQIVRFMPPGQPLTVGNPGALTASRQAVLDRYAAIIKHIDVLATALPRAFQKGLETLRQFAGDPSAQVEPFGGAAEDVIQFTLMGTFIPGEEVWINAVTAMGTRVGPAKLAPPAGFALPENQFQTQDDLLARLRLLRVAPTGIQRRTGPAPDARQDPDRRFRDHPVLPPDRLHAGFAVSAKSAADQRLARGIGGRLAGRVPHRPRSRFKCPAGHRASESLPARARAGRTDGLPVFRQHRGVRRLGQSTPVGQGGDLRQRQPVWRHSAADPLSGPGPAAGADAALQRNPDHRNDGPARCPQHHPLLQGDMGVADRRGTGDPAGPIHHRRAAQRNRRCFADDPAARLRAEQGAWILRQFDDPSVLDPAIGDRRHQPAAAGSGGRAKRRRRRRRSTRYRSNSRFWPISSRASFRPSRSSPCPRGASWAKRCSATAHRARSST